MFSPRLFGFLLGSQVPQNMPEGKTAMINYFVVIVNTIDWCPIQAVFLRCHAHFPEIGSGSTTKRLLKMKEFWSKHMSLLSAGNVMPILIIHSVDRDKA